MCLPRQSHTTQSPQPASYLQATPSAAGGECNTSCVMHGVVNRTRMQKPPSHPSRRHALSRSLTPHRICPYVHNLIAYLQRGGGLQTAASIRCAVTHPRRPRVQPAACVACMHASITPGPCFSRQGSVVSISISIAMHPSMRPCTFHAQSMQGERHPEAIRHACRTAAAHAKQAAPRH